MFNILKMQQKKIVSNAVNLIPRYRPDIDYNWTTTFDGSGNRQLINAGESNPNYKATLYSGRGVKFNGTNQSIDLSGNGYSIDLDSDFTLNFTHNDNFDTNYTYLFSLYGIGIFIYQQAGSFKVRFFSGGALTDYYVPYVAGKTNDVCIIYKKGVGFSSSIDGVFVNEFNFTDTLDRASETILGGRSSYSNCILYNISIISQALEPHEIAYQHTNPESFLYKDSSIIKSEILSQSQIDNVVAHFPMCETDGYVRNMIGHSEGFNKIDYANISIGTDGDGVSTLTLLADGFEIEQDGTGTLTERPLIIVPYLNSEVQVAGGIYIVTFRATLISGANIAKIHNVIGEYANVVLGDNYFVFTVPNDRSHAYFLFDSTVAGKVRIDNIQLKKLTSTYPIANFTNAARDDAKNLTTGLQTCFWKRDVLGVPIGSSFDELSFDGSGYANTGWVPDTSKDFTVECILSINDGTSYKGIGIENGHDCLWLRMKGKGFSGRYGIGKVVGYTTTLQFSHFTGVLTSSTNTMEFFVDGVSIGISQDDNIDITSTFTLGKINHRNEKNMTTPLRLFNIHTTPQDPAKLYADAVKKGLLL